MAFMVRLQRSETYCKYFLFEFTLDFNCFGFVATDECQTKYGNANAWRYCTKVFDMLTVAAVSVDFGIIYLSITHLISLPIFVLVFLLMGLKQETQIFV